MTATRGEANRRRSVRRQARAEQARQEAAQRQRHVTVRAVEADSWVSAADPWYVVEVETGRERRVEDELQAWPLDAWLPRVAVTVTRLGKRRELERALFPGYVLITLEGDPAARSWEIAAIEAVRGLVGFPDRAGVRRPSRLPAGFMCALVERLAEPRAADLPALELAPGLTAGEAVRIVAGPFAGFVAVVERALPGFARTLIQTEIFGQSTRLELDLAQVARL
jgi:transcription antitermination factor NusG